MKNLKKKLSKMAVSLLLATTNALTANPVITVSAVESTESPESVKEVVETAQPEGFEENLVPTEGQPGGEENNGYENNQSPAPTDISSDSSSNTAESTSSPQISEASEPTPATVVEPVFTDDPVNTADPANTGAPEGTMEPEKTVGPEATGTPEAIGTPETTGTPESVAEATAAPEEVKYPAATFVGEIHGLVITAEAPEGAFPEGTQMKLTLVEDEKILEAVEDAVKEEHGEDKKVKKAQAVDITFNYKGESIEPKDSIKVTMKSKLIEEAKKNENTETSVVHVSEDEESKELVAETVDITPAAEKGAESEDEVAFESDAFSTYVFVEVETLITELVAPNGDVYEVTLSFGPEANIPEGSSVVVTPYDEGSKEYEYALKALQADKQAKGERAVEGFAALDITIYNAEGEEIEPDAPVKVDMKIKKLPGVDNLNEVKETLEIQHHVETADGVIVEKVFSGSNVATFEQSTAQDVIAEKGDEAVDPDSVNLEDFADNSEAAEEEIDSSFVVDEFSTYTINWNYGSNITTVHYGYMNGNTFVELSQEASPVNVSTNYRTYLIYDFDGYEYSGYTYYRTSASSTPASGGTRIQAQLRYSNNNWRYHAYSTSASGDNWYSIANNSHIYVVYEEKSEPTTGGTPVIEDLKPEDWPQDPEDPQFYKSSTRNGNGTNTVSLSIKGGEEEYTQSTKANVIVVFDVSGSMGGNNIWRLNTAKSAVNQMADTLLNDASGVKMALITFSTTSSPTPVQGFTNSYDTYSSAVNSLTADGGTNWEQALYNANRLEVDDDAATFVVFVTDGDPTYRLSRYNAPDSEIQGYNRDNRYFAYNIFGTGTSDPGDRNFDAAAEEVSSILANNKTFYAIGVSSDVTKVQNLVDQAGGGTAYLATDAEALEKAFENITQSIKTNLGFGDVTITDGITELSNVEMKVMQEVDPDSFTYYKVTSSGQQEWDPASEGAGLATYNKSTGAVVWDLGEKFQLEDGVTYTVKFRVWPSQEAYDLIAELNNGEKVYAEGQPNSISAEEREQVVELKAPTATEQGSYTLKTNTDTVNATYKLTSSTGESVTVYGDKDLEATYHEGTIENMDLTSELLTIKKIFDQSLDPRTVDSVTLKLQRKVNEAGTEMADFNVPGTDSPNIVLGKHNNWQYSFYVAPGFIVDGETLEKGYQFTVTEPDLGEHTVRYDLIPEIVNPMVVDGTLQLIGDGDGNQALTAINRTRSAIEIHKTLYDVDGKTEIFPETEFTITGQLLDPDGQPYKNQETNDPAAYYLYDKDGNPTTGRMHFPDSSNISFTLKAGEFIRFVNVPEGCTFQFQESSIPDNYEMQSLAAVGRQRAEDDPAYTYSIELSDEEAHLVEDETTIATTDEGIIGNTNYKLDFYNKRTIPLPDIELVKVDRDDNTKKLNGAGFELRKDSAEGEKVTVDANGKEINILTGNKEDSEGPDGWYHIGLLPAGVYYLVETIKPAGYVLDETPTIITVTKTDDSYTVTATKDGESVITQAEDVYTITLDNTIETTELEVEKTWVNADGTTTWPEGVTVTLQLTADGQEVSGKTVTLSSTKTSDKFTSLPKYKADGTTEIEYSVAEVEVAGYESEVGEPADGKITVTNTQEETETNAKKAWKNADGSTTAPEGATVVFTLYADGTATDYTVTLDGEADTAPTGTGGYESAAWTAMFVNLPKCQDGTTTEIVYTVAETTGYPGYTASTTDPVESGKTITNTQEETEADASKAWKNADGSTTAPEGATVVFTLYADGTATDYTVTLDGTVDEAPEAAGGHEGTAWTANFVHLPKYQNGTTTEIVYTVAETTGYPEYTASTTEPVESGETITNKQEETKADASKEWKNADGSTTAPEGATVVFTLYADGKATDYTVTLDGTADDEPEGTAGYESEAWTAAFVNLPKSKVVDDEAVEIVYTVAETTGYPGYTASTTEPVASGETITNTQEETEADAFKEWKNADGSATAPEGATVVFTLYADGTATDYTVTLDGTVDEAPEAAGGYEGTAWTANFVHLPKYQSGTTTEIVYTVAETTTYPGYTASTTEPVASGETITNTQETTTADASKAWKNADGSTTAPVGATVVFTLYADGEATDYTVTLDGTADKAPTVTGGYESVAWKAAFVNLPKYQDGTTTAIIYTVAETTGYPKYIPSTTDPVASGSTITNTREVGNLKISKTVVSDLAADADKEFDSRVELSDKTVSGTFGDMEFTNGVAEFKLKGGDSKSAEGLPTDVEYTVTETADEDFETKKIGDTGTITVEKAGSAEFTNTRETGDLEVSKTVVSDLAADASKDFEFTVTLSDTSISGTYGDMTFEAGVATFTLKGGESKTAEGLPTTVTYTVEEKADDDFETEKTGDEGTITAEEAGSAEFTNTRKTGDLTVTKTLISDMEADKALDFEFTVTLSDTSISGTYGDMIFTDGVATFTL